MYLSEELQKQIDYIVNNVVNPYIELRKRVAESIPKIEIPKFHIPKIKFPEIKIDYEYIESVIDNNTSYGWTITDDMNINFYFDEEFLEMDQTEIDAVFLNYYEEDSNAEYEAMKETMLKLVNEKWKLLLADCFEAYEADKYKVIIPTLLTVIEGEISDLADSIKVGKGLLNEWEKNTFDKQARLIMIVCYSLNQYLQGKVFKYKDFTDERGSGINRNWVLHGRDNPNNWQKVDALKLFNTISTLQILK